MTQQHVAHRSGVLLEDVPTMKFMHNGRELTSRGVDDWNVDQHGFTFLENSKTILSPPDFLTPLTSSVPELFKFSGCDAVSTAQTSDVSGWKPVYYKEIAEMCKRLYPTSEAVHVAYHVLRKSDLSFSSGKYATNPLQDGVVHRLAARIVSGLDNIDFMPVARLEHFQRLLAQGQNQQFVEEIIGEYAKSIHIPIDGRQQLVDLLHVNTDYDFVNHATEAINAVVAKQMDTRVEPEVPESAAHQVVCQMVKSFEFLDLYPEDYKQTIGRQLHLEGFAGIEAYLTTLVEGNSVSREVNAYALMPDANAELQAEVMSLLRESKYYDFVPRAKRLVPYPTDSTDTSASVTFQPPALGGGHTDVNAEGYLQQLQAAIPDGHDLCKPSTGCKRRVVFLKFWRNISETPIQNHHLAVLDKTSIVDSDIHEDEINFKGIVIKQNRLNADVNDAKLRWVYFPNMNRDEVLCFQQGDLTLHSSGDASFPEFRQHHATFHGAFEDPTASKDVAPRQSIESAAFIFLPEEPEVVSKL